MKKKKRFRPRRRGAGNSQVLLLEKNKSVPKMLDPVKLEYDYLALSSWNSATVPAVGLNRDVQMIKAGINYKLESGLPTEAEAFACRSLWRACKRRRPAEGITEPDRRSGQRSIPEQYQF